MDAVPNRKLSLLPAKKKTSQGKLTSPPQDTENEMDAENADGPIALFLWAETTQKETVPVAEPTEDFLVNCYWCFR